MPITSYAQNFEDVILWRALKHVEHGFYIDIGAQDPVIDSVSLAFYEQGWRGTHIEPTATYATNLRSARPDEEVIEAAIGTGSGLLAFHEFPGTGLSTGDAGIARQHAEAGFDMKEHLVPVVSLQSVLDRSAERQVHWLKIDVEGMEAAVIESWGSSAVRPWIVVVESTVPRSSETSHEAWDPGLRELGYDFVYFDGLNRFYVSEKHPELKASFGPGPNCFDSFAFPASCQSSMFAPMRQRLEAVEERKVEVEHQLEQAATEIVALNARLVALEADLRDAEVARSDADQRTNDTTIAIEAAMASTAQQLRQLTDNLAAQSKLMQTGNVALTNTVAGLGKQLTDIVRDKAVAARDAEISQLRHLLSGTQVANAEQLALKEAAIHARDAEIVRLSESIEALSGQVGHLSAATEAFQKSTSWKVSAPLRGIKYAYRDTSSWPKTKAHLFLSHALLWVGRRPGIRLQLRRAVRLIPPLERRLLLFAHSRRHAAKFDDGTHWVMEPDPGVLAEWNKILSNTRN